ncbi:MAG: aldehyde ferredoxin oxidoreductase N-terminal domain-containing protein [Bacteroidales bacterium]
MGRSGKYPNYQYRSYCGIIQYSGTGKSLVVTLSPQTEIPIDSNVGGHFGPFLKFCGFDSLSITGKAKQDVIILIDETNYSIGIYETNNETVDNHILAQELHHAFADDDKDLKNVSVVSAGSAADHSLIGMLNFSFYDNKRKEARLKQAGRGGCGTVLRDKKILAIVAKIKGNIINRNNVVNLEAISEQGQRFNKEMRELDNSQCEMRAKGTVHLTNIIL